MADLLNVTTGGGQTVRVEDVSTSKNDWRTIKSDSYKPDKDKWIVDQFKSEFTSITVPTGDTRKEAEFVYALISRNKKLSTWLEKANVKWVSIVAVPESIKDLIPVEDFKTVESSLRQVNASIASESLALAAAATEYSNKRAKIIRERSDEREKLLDNDTVRILSLKVEDLPVTLSMAIEKYSNSVQEGMPNAKAYSREVLLNYQRQLIQLKKENPDLNIKNLIDELATK